MSVDTGMQKYAAKTGAGSIGAQKWDAAKGQMPGNWAAGLRAAGATPGPLTTRAYQEGISRATYRGGNPDKWRSNFLSGISK